MLNLRASEEPPEDELSLDGGNGGSSQRRREERRRGGEKVRLRKEKAKMTSRFFYTEGAK